MATSKCGCLRKSGPLPHPESPHEALDRVFRSAHGRITAALVRCFGCNQLPSIENVIQEAGVRALERWHKETLPRDPESWLLRVAHNLFIDSLKRERRNSAIEAGDITVAPLECDVDDELRLIFLCCHPELTPAAQIALTLRIAYGFSAAQIARAFLSDERTVAQRIVRAKQRIRDLGCRFEVPEADELPLRLDSILRVLYQIFAEGYAPTADESGINEELCNESLRLVRLLSQDPRTSSPETEALRSLFCFQHSRAPARLASDGSLLLLHEQDRTLWAKDLIAEGFQFLARGARGEQATRFHCEAGIAACHALAKTYASTDWVQIVSLYELLRVCARSPVVEVNRAFAIAMCRGATAGLDELDAIPERDFLARYPYALAAYSELHASLGQFDVARTYLDRAIVCQTSPAESRLLKRKRTALQGL